MATPPLSASLIAGVKDVNAWRFETTVGTVFEPRWFCCSSPNEINPVDGKEPVAVLELKPNPMFTGTSACFDGSLSYDPDGTVTGYSWTFESGTPATDSTASGNVSWSASGTYEVKLVVTDGTGLQSSPAIVEAVVIDVGTGEYYTATASGVYYTDNSGAASWVERSSNLAGDALNVNDVVIDPATRNLGDGNRTVWIGTASGVWVSKDGETWHDKTPSTFTNSWVDSPSPTNYDLSYDHLVFQGNRLWVAGNWITSGSNRAWLFYTDSASEARSNPAVGITWKELL